LSSNHYVLSDFSASADAGLCGYNSIFTYFNIPDKYQHRVLFYGIIGALIFRCIFIAVGAALIQYYWVVVLFGVFLILTGIKVILAPEKPLDPEKKPAVHTTPLNHVGLWIDDLPQAVAWLTAQGVRFAPGGIRKGAAGFDITFIHPKGHEESPIGGEGVLIELVQAPPEVVKAFAALAAAH
jgi:hypothetical protein